MLVTVSFLPFKTEVNPQNPTFNVNVNGRKNPSHFPVIMFNTKQVSYRFTNMRVPKVFLPPLEIRIYGQRLAFLVIFGQTLVPLVHCGAMPDQKKWERGA